MASSVYFNGKRFEEHGFSKEKELEKKVIDNYQLFFGSRSIYIDAKKKIETKALGSSIPDGFLFDLRDKDDPQFYLVEIELSSHDFYRHIFPQITKFFAFYQNTNSRNDLIEKIFSIVNKDEELKGKLRRLIGKKEIFKFIKDTIENSQNIILVLDNSKEELPEIFQTYTDTWDKMVHVLYIKEFCHGNQSIFLSNPDFGDIGLEVEEPKKVATEYTEEFHLEGVAEPLKEAYYHIKRELLNFNESIGFNPQHYYLSLRYRKNYAYLKFRKKKIKITIMIDEDEVRQRIKHHKVKSHSESVQKYYGGACCQIIVEDNAHLDEVIDILKEPVRRMKK